MFDSFELELFKGEPQWKTVCNLILESGGFLCLWRALRCYRAERFGVENTSEQEKEMTKLSETNMEKHLWCLHVGPLSTELEENVHLSSPNTNWNALR